MEKIKVIDISYAQQNVDFEAVKTSGVKAVIIRTGYFGKTDTMFNSHMEGAIAAGLDVGVYTYIMSDNAAQAALEAQETINRIDRYRGKITYPVYCDMENGKYYSEEKFDDNSRTRIIETFCSVISGAGYYPAVYINPSWLEQWTVKERILENYDIWLAAWTQSADIPTRYNYGQKMWQWGTEAVKGINGDVDSNICYVDYPAIIRKSGRNYLSDKYLVTAEKEIAAEELASTEARLKSLGFTVKAEIL